MPELVKPERGYLNIPICGKEYKIPLAKNIKVKQIKKMSAAAKAGEFEMLDFMIDFFSQYVPESVIDELEQDELIQLFNLWKAANEEGERISTGESSASPSS